MNEPRRNPHVGSRFADLNDDFMLNQKDDDRKIVGTGNSTETWGRLHYSADDDHISIPRDFTFSMDVGLAIFLRDAMTIFIKEHEKFIKTDDSFIKDLNTIKDNFNDYARMFSADAGFLEAEEEQIKKAREAFRLLSKHFPRLWT